MMTYIDDADIFTNVHNHSDRRVGNLLVVVGRHCATTMTPLALMSRDRRADGHAKCICEAPPKARQCT